MARNLLMWSDFTLGPSVKVKQWLISFGELLSGGYNLRSTFCVILSPRSGNAQALSRYDL